MQTMLEFLVLQILLPVIVHPSVGSVTWENNAVLRSHPHACIQQLCPEDGVRSVLVAFATTKRMIVANVKPASEYLCSNIIMCS